MPNLSNYSVMWYCIEDRRVTAAVREAEAAARIHDAMEFQKKDADETQGKSRHDHPFISKYSWEFIESFAQNVASEHFADQHEHRL